MPRLRRHRYGLARLPAAGPVLGVRRHRCARPPKAEALTMIPTSIDTDCDCEGVGCWDCILAGGWPPDDEDDLA